MADQSPVEVEPGQYWNWNNEGYQSTRAPGRIRVLARYPDESAGDRIWIVETTMRADHIWRIPEKTLRVYYELDEKGAL